MQTYKQTQKYTISFLFYYHMPALHVLPTEVDAVVTASDLVRAEEDGQEGRLRGPAFKRTGYVRGCARAVTPERVRLQDKLDIVGRCFLRVRL